LPDDEYREYQKGGVEYETGDEVHGDDGCRA
jgi:hypothetical protein